MRLASFALSLMAASTLCAQAPEPAIPLPEHPRPDFARAEWVNLNGAWRFAFDEANAGVSAGWAAGTLPGDRTITVPFSWGSTAYKYPSAVSVRVNGALMGRYELADDPADSRGILSWNAQPYDRTLHEAGSYGELLRVPLTAAAIAESARTGEIMIRLEVSDALPGGLAVYGARFGRYPIDPSVVFVLRDP